jgi:hypothetical protein
MVKIKRFDKVRVIRNSDSQYNRIGVVVSIVKSSNYPYNVCFGVDRFGNGIIHIYFESDLRLEK